MSKFHSPYRYDVVVDVAPDIKWLSENKYKNLKVTVEIDNSINAQSAAEMELRRRLKALGSMRIVTNRGLQVIFIKINFTLSFTRTFFLINIHLRDLLY